MMKNGINAALFMALLGHTPGHAAPMTGEAKQESTRLLLLLNATPAPCNDAELNKAGVLALCGNTRLKALQYKDAWLKSARMVYDNLKVIADYQGDSDFKYKGLFTRSYTGNNRAFITYYRVAGVAGQVVIVQTRAK